MTRVLKFCLVCDISPLTILQRLNGASPADLPQISDVFTQVAVKRGIPRSK